jgi:uncharacterized protein YndB with AHSA1/START domain
VKPILIQRSRIVAVPSDVIWEFVEPAERLSAWLPVVTSSRHLAGQGVGRRQRARPAWSATDVTQEVTIHTPGKKLAWKQIADASGGPAPDDISMTIEMESNGPGTRVVLGARIVPKSLADAARHKLTTARRIGRGFDRALAQLAAIGG